MYVKNESLLQDQKGLFQNVVILGPERKEAQVEVSMTDT